MLVCKCCLISKDVNDFHKNSRNKSGRYSYCKACDYIKKSTNPRIKEYKKQYRLSNPSKVKSEHKSWRDRNKDKVRKLYRKYADSHKEHLAYKSAKRRADILHRTPTWANLDTIKTIYMNCPKGYHVDHIIPLNGENISGLHVAENLQYLKAEDNILKSNKF